jgi:hypothetical protein
MVMLILMAGCASDEPAQPFEAVAARAQAVADWFGIDTAATPLATSQEVPSCPDARGVSSSAEVVGMGRVEMDELATFVAAQFDDVAQASYFGGLGHPHGLAWVVFDDGSKLTVIDSYGTINTLFMVVFDCHS